MSHTTTISTLLLSDKAAIKGAIKELQAQGVKCDLLEAVIPRSYAGNQMKKADFCLKLHDSPYDVGMYANKDGEYSLATDFYQGHVEGILGVTPGKDDNRDQAKLGKLYQAYATNAIERQAAQQGYSVSRLKGESGGVRLVLGVPA
jgi:hypothetical protein